ncbi:ankyrin repeat-containing domain protein [Triangularia verruculosa]|uniref:Ankyrin repeat-containing domain protein n=1 Tax=Triangularia verruculosa TaxID=2587418 RepID=A0AAN7B014_9PEZI|nr:ankyrin repeat-containing domain protein [Triangularia verruculosa]
MDVLGAVLGVSTLIVRTTCAVYTLVDTWREAPEGLHRLLDELRRSQQFFDETEAGLREMYLVLSEEAREMPSFRSVTETLVGLFEEAAGIIGRIEETIKRIVDGNGLLECGSIELGKRRRLAWLRRTAEVTGLRKSLKSVTVGVHRLLVVQNIRMSLGVSAAVERSTCEIKSHVPKALETEVLSHVAYEFEALRVKLLSEMRDPILRRMTMLEDKFAKATDARNTLAQAPFLRHGQRRRRCEPHCCCRCHLATKYSLGHGSWQLSLFGLTIRVSGGSTGGECTSRTCERAYLRQAKEVLLFFDCPTWLFRGGISAVFSSNLHGSPELNIRVFNRLETDTPASATNIFGSIERGNIEAVKQLLKEGRASIYDLRGNTNETPLYAALYQLNMPIVRLLLQAGADPFAEAERNPKILYEVIQIYVSARPEAAELISLIPAFDRAEMSPLHLVISRFLHLSIDEALCKPEYLSYVNHIDPESTWTPLDLAALRGDTSAISKLLKAGASVTLRNKSGAPSLFQACWFGHYEVAKLLVDAGADVNETVTDCGKIPRICATNAVRHTVDAEVVSLLRRRVKSNKSWKGASPLCFAATQTNRNTVAFLIDRGANVNHTDDEGATPLVYAILHLRHENARLLLKHGGSYRFVTHTWRTILHYLAEIGDVEIIKIFTKIKMRGLVVDLKGNRKLKTPMKIFNERQSTVELRRTFNELLESVNKDDEQSDGSDEFYDASEEMVK